MNLILFAALTFAGYWWTYPALWIVAMATWLPLVTRIAHAVGINLHGTIVSLDGVYDCRTNRKAIFNRGMIPNINANPRGRKTFKRGRKPLFNSAIFKERFHTIERVFGWEDKFRLDVDYVDHHTFVGDLRILLGTVRSVARRDGISEAGETTSSEFLGSSNRKEIA